MKFNFLFILLFFGFGFNIFATNHSPFVITYDKNDYGASSKNWSVSVNSKGLVYIGNHEGLLEGDGQSWKLYKLPTGGIVRSVAIDDKDRIYTGSYEDFGYWESDNTGVLHYTSLKERLKNFNFHNENIWKIIIRDNSVFFQAFSKVFIYSHDSIEVSVPENNIIFLLEAGDKLIAQSVTGGLVELKNNKFIKIKNSESLEGAEIKVVMPFRNSGFILGSGTRGLYLWKDGKFRIWDCEAHRTLKNKQINHGIYYNGSYYIGTITDGVYIINQQGDIISHLNTNNSLLNNTILGMHFDAEGNLWLNHDKGLSFVHFNYPYYPVINTNNKLGAVHTAALYKNKLYLGTNQGVYYVPVENGILTNEKLEDFKFVEGSQGQVWDLKIFDNQLLCGHNKGTFRIEQDKFIQISPVSGGFSLIRLSDKNLIQSTYTNLIIFRKNKKNNWEFSNIIDGFSEPLKYVETDFRGNIWVSHNLKGIYKLQVSNDYTTVLSSEYYGKKQGFDYELKTHAFKLDNRIVFTSGNGIYTYDDLKDSVIIYNELNEKLGDFRNAERIIAASNSRYWFIQKKGVALFKIKGGNVKQKLLLHLNKPGYHLVDTNPNIIPISKSQHLICLEDGFLILNPNHILSSKNLKQIIIREVSEGAQESRLPQNIEHTQPEITFKNNSITFSFSPIIFPGSGNLFSVKLEGLNNNWSEYTNNSVVNYSRLPWGDYTFRVKGIDDFGTTIAGASYSFRILPPWYATSIALFGYFILIISSFIIFPIVTRRYFIKQKEEYKRKQQKIFIEKQKEQKLLAEQKIVKLRNQHLQSELKIKSEELANNTMIIIRRNETLTEIKEEFEKQKLLLGTRFPNKNYEKIINLINRNLKNEEEWKVFEFNFDQAHNNFFKRLKKQFNLLTPGDLRLCAYLHLNLTSKEIAPLLNISTRGVEIHRYRLRKKLGLTADENLVEFILQF